MEPLSPNTEVTLLLCGRFGAKSEDVVKPLEPRELIRLQTWLEEHGMRLADLLEGGPPSPPDPLSLEGERGNRCGADRSGQVFPRQEPPEGRLGDPSTPKVNPPSSLPSPPRGRGAGGEGGPPDPDRLAALLDRGGALALAVEGWQSKGLWVVGRGDVGYPERLLALGRQAPPLVYGAGDRSSLAVDGPALAVVGSRDVDEAAIAYTRAVARACAEAGIPLVSGGARGVDTEAMVAALGAGGWVVGVLADSLARAARSGRYRQALLDGTLALVSPYDPASGFNVGNAMGRNKYIYALAGAGLVISTAAGEGGTWAGAVEALERGVPVFVRLGEDAPPGNVELLARGAHAFPEEPWDGLRDWLAQTLTDARDDGDMVQGQLPLLP